MAYQGSKNMPEAETAGQCPTVKNLASEECGSYIPGLPNDLAIQCLLRLPRSEHQGARKVCKLWFDFIQSANFYKLRQVYSLAEGWIYLLARDANERLSWHALDPSQRLWHAVPRMPNDVARLYGLSVEASQGCLYVVGGVGWTKPPREDVLRFDSRANTWSRVASLQEPRCYAVSGVLGGRLLVAGGNGTSSSGLLTSLEVYDPTKDEWSFSTGLLNEGDLRDSVVWNGKLHVSHIRCLHTTPDPHAQIYDPLSQEWTFAQNEMTSGWQGPCTVLDGDLYMVDQISNGVKLMVYSEKIKGWESLGRLSPALLTPPCKLVGLNGKLYVVGRGSTVIEVFVEDLEKSRGVLVTRKIGGGECNTDIVLGCFVVEI